MAALLLIAVLALVIATGCTSLWLSSEPDLPTLQRIVRGAALWTGAVVVAILLGLLPMVAAELIFDIS